ncbi:haloacid dehalogenase [Pseudoalteromonas luteoviolacea]|uniref:Enolase-phosphatase E1 n=1 Tax=Pseudoalteromonas luteoviolacea TaxID=43657 RepID=A0A0C1Q750_9GAMM|nr:acireductone synthase [Pseudoalteromonas luteoviolacea]KID55370.1 haloacid dehalogenase [Pseudoalteromonas luteoviolacea]
MIKAILTDIEGTITRISFVKEILFPYAAKHLAGFVKNSQDEPQVRAQLDAVRAEIAQPDASLDTVIDTLLGWIEADKKITPLKQLQGLVWQDGYQQKDFTGHIYPDAHAYLTAQHQAGTALYVYSSGSVKAQQLLFAHSDFGDIRGLFSDYFDTRVGAKQQPESYHNIVQNLPFEAHEVLFLSDVVAELDAAKAAGLQTLQLWRDDQPKSPNHAFITSFEHL